jgi:hypothetical protein
MEEMRQATYCHHAFSSMSGRREVGDEPMVHQFSSILDSRNISNDSIMNMVTTREVVLFSLGLSSYF